MPDEIYGVMAVKNGQKQTIMNLSNARQKSYADLQTMTDAQKKGVIVCPDYPKEEFLVTADEVSYGGGTVKDALDKAGKYTKLWENPNPSADFSPTSIAVGENYDQMMIVADSNTLFVSNALGATTSMFLGTIGGASYGFTRRFTYQGGNVIIQDGYSYRISDGTRVTNNSIIIPLAIYGIKF